MVYCLLQFFLEVSLLYFDWLQIFFRDTMMHKKGFEELVEGAEVAYYVRGKVVVSLSRMIL